MFCCRAARRIYAHLILVDSAHLREEDARRASQGHYSSAIRRSPSTSVADAWARCRSCSPWATTGRCRSSRLERPASVADVFPRSALLRVVMKLYGSGAGDRLWRRPRPLHASGAAGSSADRRRRRAAVRVHVRRSSARARRRGRKAGGDHPGDCRARRQVIIRQLAIGRVEECFTWLKQARGREADSRAAHLRRQPDGASKGSRLREPIGRARQAGLRGSRPQADARLRPRHFETSSAAPIAPTSSIDQAGRHHRRRSGMATGGRVLRTCSRTLPDPRNTVLFVGLPGGGHAGPVSSSTASQTGEDARAPDRRARPRIRRSTRMSAHADAERNHPLAAAASQRPAPTCSSSMAKPDAQDALRARSRKRSDGRRMIAVLERAEV